MTATLKPKQLRDLMDALRAAHPESEFQQPIPVNNASKALVRVLTTKDADTVKAWWTLAGYESDLQTNQNQDGFIVEFWKVEAAKKIGRNGRVHG